MAGHNGRDIRSRPFSSKVFSCGSFKIERSPDNDIKIFDSGERLR